MRRLLASVMRAWCGMLLLLMLLNTTSASTAHRKDLVRRIEQSPAISMESLGYSSVTCSSDDTTTGLLGRSTDSDACVFQNVCVDLSQVQIDNSVSALTLCVFLFFNLLHSFIYAARRG
jgi:hypothetical protein